MGRAGLIIALAVAVLAGVIFGLNADLDLSLSRPFFGIPLGSHGFALSLDPVVQMVREAGKLWVSVLVLSAIVTFAVKLVRPRARLLMSARTMIFLLATFVLGPGAMANAVLKEHWARSRPVDVTEFGGTEKFVPWWDPRGDCRKNCSFVSGDVSAAFWTLAPAALAPPAWRALAYGGALAFGVAASLLRMAAGAHFLTDAVFAGVFTFLIIWGVHGMMYRWRRTRLSDENIEGAIERAALRAQEAWLGLFGKRLPQA
jgi:lipid A 4'-phosphatase